MVWLFFALGAPFSCKNCTKEIIAFCGGPSGIIRGACRGYEFPLSKMERIHVYMPTSSSALPALPTAAGTQSIMDTYPSLEELRTILQDSIETVINHHGLYHQAAHFSRAARKLPLEKLVDFIFSLQSQNLPIQIAAFSGFNEDNQFANSTLSEARSKISPLFFREIFDQVFHRLKMTGAFNLRKYKYPTYAIDGTTLHLEPFNKDSDDFLRTKSPDRKRAGAHAVACYDVDNKLFTDVIVQKLAHKNERKAALKLMEKAAEKAIYIMDRGFHGFSFECAIMDKNQLFLIRMKKRDYQSLLQIREEYDIDPAVDITKNLILVGKYLKQYKGDALHYPLRGKDKSCLGPDGKRNYTVRLLKLKTDFRPDAAEPYQYFVTNLPEDEFTRQDILDLYKSRWSVETGFQELKYSTGLQAVHARKMDAVNQEVWVRLTLCNLCSAGVAYCEEHRPAPKKPPRRKTVLNRKYAFELLRKFFNYEILEEEYVIREIWKHTSQIKPGRYYKRHTQRKPDSNQHRIL